MSEAIDPIQEGVQDHAAHSHLNGFIDGLAGFRHWNLHSGLMAKVLG